MYKVGQRVIIVTNNSQYYGCYGRILICKQWSDGSQCFDLIVKLDNGRIIDQYNSFGYQIVEEGSKRKLPAWF